MLRSMARRQCICGVAIQWANTCGISLDFYIDRQERVYWYCQLSHTLKCCKWKWETVKTVFWRHCCCHPSTPITAPHGRSSRLLVDLASQLWQFPVKSGGGTLPIRIRLLFGIAKDGDTSLILLYYFEAVTPHACVSYHTSGYLSARIPHWQLRGTMVNMIWSRIFPARGNPGVLLCLQTRLAYQLILVATGRTERCHGRDCHEVRAAKCDTAKPQWHPDMCLFLPSSANWGVLPQQKYLGRFRKDTNTVQASHRLYSCLRHPCVAILR